MQASLKRSTMASIKPWTALVPLLASVEACDRVSAKVAIYLDGTVFSTLGVLPRVGFQPLQYVLGTQQVPFVPKLYGRNLNQGANCLNFMLQTNNVIESIDVHLTATSYNNTRWAGSVCVGFARAWRPSLALPPSLALSFHPRSSLPACLTLSDHALR